MRGADNTEDGDDLMNPQEQEWRSGIAYATLSRLTERREWLRRLHGIPSGDDTMVENSPDTVITVKPDALVFDDMLPYLRQHMPPFTVTIPSHEEAKLEMRRNIEAIERLEVLGDDLLSWQIASRGRAWVKRDTSIVKSLYKVSQLDT